MSIASELNRLIQAKSDLATSITNKGVTVPAATTLDGYAALVDQIQQGGTPLPYDAEIEYLESTGTQWINTGLAYNVSKSYDMIFDGYFTGSTNYEHICGITGGTSGTNVCRLCFFVLLNGKMAYGSNVTFSATTFAANVRHKTHVLLLSNPASYLFSQDGSVATYSATIRADLANGKEIYLFARNNLGTASNFANAKLYEFIVFENDNLVRFFIPVRVGQVGCLYDRVSGSLFYNQGTGSFTLGPDVT